jgi:hypothetical protein
MKRTIGAIALLALLAGCDSDQQNTRSDTDPVTTKGQGTAPAERDPTPQSGTGGDSQSNNQGMTTTPEP